MIEVKLLLTVVCIFTGHARSWCFRDSSAAADAALTSTELASAASAAASAAADTAVAFFHDDAAEQGKNVHICGMFCEAPLNGYLILIYIDDS
jgi:hypothetical protein